MKHHLNNSNIMTKTFCKIKYRNFHYDNFIMLNNKQFDAIKQYLDEEVCLLVDEDLQQPLQRVYHDSQSSLKNNKKTLN